MKRFLTVLCFIAAVRAGTFEEANSAYSSGDYAKAAAAYENVISREGFSAARLYNLGNARFRLGEFGPAILAYERAAILSPRDPEIQANLKLARDAAKAPASEPDRPWWEVPLHWLSLQEWSWLAAGGAVVISIMAALAAFSRKYRFKALGAMTVGVVVVVLSATALVQRRTETQRAIVIAAAPRLLLSPFPQAGSAGSLSTGPAVQVEKTEKGWLYVSTLTGGIKGWLPVSEAGWLVTP